jgi:hypothetical protein
VGEYGCFSHQGEERDRKNEKEKPKGWQKVVNKQDKKNGKEKIKRREEGYRKQENKTAFERKNTEEVRLGMVNKGK